MKGRKLSEKEFKYGCKGCNENVNNECVRIGRVSGNIGVCWMELNEKEY